MTGLNLSERFSRVLGSNGNGKSDVQVTDYSNNSMFLPKKSG